MEGGDTCVDHSTSTHLIYFFFKRKFFNVIYEGLLWNFWGRVESVVLVPTILQRCDARCITACSA